MKRHKDKDQEKIIRCVGRMCGCVGRVECMGFGRVKEGVFGGLGCVWRVGVVGWEGWGGRVGVGGLGWEGGGGRVVGSCVDQACYVCAGVAETAFTQVGVHNCIVL